MGSCDGQRKKVYKEVAVAVVTSVEIALGIGLTGINLPLMVAGVYENDWLGVAIFGAGLYSLVDGSVRIYNCDFIDRGEGISEFLYHSPGRLYSRYKVWRGYNRLGKGTKFI